MNAETGGGLTAEERERLLIASHTVERQHEIGEALFSVVERIMAARVAAARAAGRESLADAWDEGVKCAGSYGHEDSWTHDMTPYSENPYRALVAPTGHDDQTEKKG